MSKSIIEPDSKVELNVHFHGLGLHPRRAQRKVTSFVSALMAQASRKGESMSRRQARKAAQRARGLR